MFFLVSNNADFIKDALRSLFASIDIVIYKFFAFLYQLFEYIAKLDIYESINAGYLFERIQILISVIALFCLSVSVIRYIIDPDTLSDKNKGASAIIRRVLISVVLLISLNSIFEEARNIQKNIIFEGNTNIASRLLGNVSSTSADGNAPGLQIALDTFFAFFRGNPLVEKSDEYANKIQQLIYDSAKNNIDSWDTIVGSVNDKSGNIYYYKYDYLISTLTGGVLIYIMICYCISVGVRAVKLVFLQLISPLPIIMNITDKGQETFKKWAKQCVSTYFDLVIKLFIINLVITFSSVILTSTNTDSLFSGISQNMVGWVKVVMVVSLLIFAKKAIDLIKDLFPGVGSDDLSLKKLVGSAFGKGTIGGAIGGFVGATAGLGAKKLISGIDSAKHGKGFMAGARKVQGKGALSKFNKWYDGLTPNRIENRNKIETARNELEQERKSMERGRKLYQKHGDTLTADLFNNSEFRTSWQELVNAKKEQDEANNKLEKITNRYRLNPTDENLQAEWEAAKKASRDADKKVEKLSKDHDKVRTLYADDAQREDDYNLYKKYTSPDERDTALNSATRSSATNNSTTARGPGFTGSTGNGVSPTTNNNNNSSIRDNNNSPRNFFGDDGGDTGE